MGRERRVRKATNHDYDLNKLFDLFMAEKKRNGRSADTIRNYECDYQRFLAFLNQTKRSLKCAAVTIYPVIHDRLFTFCPRPPFGCEPSVAK